MDLNKSFWNEKYLTNQTPWDIGYISPPLKEFIENLSDTQALILIPGAGRAYEAMFLHMSGFRNVFVCDWAEGAFEYLLDQCPDFPPTHLLVEDFFMLEGKYDFILEQTFFCAIDPKLRPDYARKAADLLKEGGMLSGLLFASEFENEGPPFGGTKKEYEKLFSPYFHILEMTLAPNSISPRLGNELFFKMIAK